MTTKHRLAFACIAVWLAVTPAASAQPNSQSHDPHIGYVYPAGGRAGTTFKVKVGGQYVEKVEKIYVSGDGVTANVLDFYIPMTQQQANSLRNTIGEARDKAEAELGDGTKGGKRVRIEDTAVYARFLKEMGVTDEQLEALKDYDQRRNDEKRQPNPQIDEMLTVEMTLAEDAGWAPRNAARRLPTVSRIRWPFTWASCRSIWRSNRTMKWATPRSKTPCRWC